VGWGGGGGGGGGGGHVIVHGALTAGRSVDLSEGQSGCSGYENNQCTFWCSRVRCMAILRRKWRQVVAAMVSLWRCKQATLCSHHSGDCSGVCSCLGLLRITIRSPANQISLKSCSVTRLTAYRQVNRSRRYNIFGAVKVVIRETCLYPCYYIHKSAWRWPD